MASTLAALTSITSFLADAYFQMGLAYHSLPDPIPSLRDTFTVSPARELPDLITVFGMVEARLLRARAAMLVVDESAMTRELWVAQELIFEAWWKVSWIDRLMANEPDNGECEALMENGEDGVEKFEKWRGALPDCCGARVPMEEVLNEKTSSIENWLEGVACC